MGKVFYPLMILGLAILILASCTQKEIIVIPDNDSPSVNNVPAIRIENYVNRVFIDLLGREPLDTEIIEEVAALKEKELTKAARIELISKLQTGTFPVQGDTTYLQGYHKQLYNLAKARCLDGVGDQVFRSLQTGVDNDADYQRLQLVMDSPGDMQAGLIQIHELFGRMIYNVWYDELNMNTFNFINASFDNLFVRPPTDAEFAAGFKMVEDNVSATLFGHVGQNKTDYVNIVINSREMFEGLIIWTYQQALSRRPTTVETAALLEDFLNHKDIKIIQQEILSADEYANF